MAGRDVMGLAQTAPARPQPLRSPSCSAWKTGSRGRVRALIVAPTRELAEQIRQAFADLGRQTRLRSVSIYGGVGFGPQVQALRSGPEIVVLAPAGFSITSARVR